MNYSCYISFDLTGLTDGSSWTVQTNEPDNGVWAINPPASLNAGKSYGESVAVGISSNIDTQSAAQLADLKGFNGTSGSLVLTGPLQSNQEPVTLTCTFTCPTGLSNNEATISLANNIAGSYSATYYCCSDTPSSSNPYYIIFVLSSAG